MEGVPIKRFVLDSSYILPLFGVDIDIKGFRESFRGINFSKAEFYVSTCSFIEIKWIIYHLIKNAPEKKDMLFQDYQEGLIYVTKSKQLELVTFYNIEVDVISNKVRDIGLTDYFDTIIYATAKVIKACLITEDQELKRISEMEPIKNEVINWKTFIEIYL